MSKKKDEICGLPEQQKLPAREAPVSKAKPKMEIFQRQVKTINNLLTINLLTIKKKGIYYVIESKGS